MLSQIAESNNLLRADLKKVLNKSVSSRLESLKLLNVFEDKTNAFDTFASSSVKI